MLVSAAAQTTGDHHKVLHSALGLLSRWSGAATPADSVPDSERHNITLAAADFGDVDAYAHLNSNIVLGVIEKTAGVDINKIAELMRNMLGADQTGLIMMLFLALLCTVNQGNYRFINRVTHSIL